VQAIPPQYSPDDESIMLSADQKLQTKSRLLAASLAADAALGVAYADLGVSVNLNKAGAWLLMAVAALDGVAANVTSAQVKLVINAVDQAGIIDAVPEDYTPGAQFWAYTAATAGPLVAKLQGKASNAAVVTAKATNTRLIAVYIGGP
jgi:hypothetical protein